MNVRPLHALHRTAPALLAAWAFLFVFSGPATATELSPVTDAVVDRIIVEKSKRTMTLLKQDREVRTYKIALGRDPVGPKVQQGDKRHPRGSIMSITRSTTASTTGRCTSLIRTPTTSNGQDPWG